MKTRELNPIDRNIANNITKYLSLRGKKQYELADYLGVSINSLSRYCSGISTPTDEQLLKISEFLGVTLYDLMGVANPLNLAEEEWNILHQLREHPEYIPIVKRVIDIK